VSAASAQHTGFATPPSPAIAPLTGSQSVAFDASPNEEPTMRHAMPDPTAKSQRWSVAYDGQSYDVKFLGDEPCEVQVRVKRRMGMEGWRMLWSRYGHREIKDRAAEIIGFVQDPATAEKAGAVVEDEAMSAARTGRRKASFSNVVRASSEPGRVGRRAKYASSLVLQSFEGPGAAERPACQLSVRFGAVR
jgi:hypothetical protein